MTGVEFDDSFFGGVKMEYVLLGVLHVGMEISKLELDQLGGDGGVVGEGLHYSGVVSGPLHGTGQQ